MKESTVYRFIRLGVLLNAKQEKEHAFDIFTFSQCVVFVR